MIKLLEKYKRKINLHYGKTPYSEYVTEDGRIAYYDWWKCNPEEFWFTRFIRKNFPNQKHKINFYSVFGKGRFINTTVEGKKVFFSGENIDDSKSITKWKTGNYSLDHADLSLGFGEISNAKYLRFPLWIMYVFSPEADEIDILRTIEDINFANYNKTKDCAVIARHDIGGTRQIVCDGVSDILEIQYAGAWRNNTSDLMRQYNDDKIEYLKNFRFNICPENVNTRLYVSEKIFECFMAGTIPIYYGSDNDPEPGIINKDAVIFWYPEGNHAARMLIRELNFNEKKYRAFMTQKKLLPYATEYILSAFRELKKRLSYLV